MKMVRIQTRPSKHMNVKICGGHVQMVFCQMRSGKDFNVEIGGGHVQMVRCRVRSAENCSNNFNVKMNQ